MRNLKLGPFASESFDFSPKYKPAQNIMAKWYGLLEKKYSE